MSAALATLTFLGTLWLLVVVGAAILEQNGPKIVAALRGDVVRRPNPNSGRPRLRPRVQLPMHASERWRAAA